MPIYRIQTSLRDKSGLPRDQYVSTLHVAPADGVADLTDVSAACYAVTNFYKALKGYMSPCIATGLHTAKAYLVTIPPDDAAPVVSVDWEMNPAPSGGALPIECAVCLSFHALRQPGIQPQSTRGRIFFGPLDDTAMAFDAPTGETHVAAAMQGAMNDAAQTMNNVFQSVGLVWVIYSRVHNTGYPVVNVSVDNEFDTVRSRGKRATNNAILPLAAHGTTPIPNS